MAKGGDKSVDVYLNELPEDRRAVMKQMRDLVLKHLPKGYRETVNWGMISYEIPLERYSETYNGQPLGYVALASQKNYCAIYLMGTYSDPRQRAALEAAFVKAGKRMDMGKSCLRFKTPDDLPLDAVGQIIASTTPAQYIAMYQASRPSRPATKSRKRAG